MVHCMSTLALCVILLHARRSDCTALAKSRHLLHEQQVILRAVEQSCAVSVNIAIICCIKQTDTSVVGLQVLRDLGISEARLQNGLVEVWNKTDLLPSEPPTDSHAQLQPTCEASHEPASTGAKQDYQSINQYVLGANWDPTDKMFSLVNSYRQDVQ